MEWTVKIDIMNDVLRVKKVEKWETKSNELFYSSKLELSTVLEEWDLLFVG